jgi:diaminopimelate decarboxylase
LNVDAMSPGELYVELKAGFRPSQILFISNNVESEEMNYAINAGVTVSVDAVSQLELFGKINPGGKVAIRFNPGVGAGHHEKVITAGKDTKFGVDPAQIDDVKAVLEKYQLNLVGINQHIGSLFMTGEPYIESVKELMQIAKQFKTLEWIDLGGGFGIPYKKKEGEKRLKLDSMGDPLKKLMLNINKEFGRELTFKIEPGRYIVAECGVLLGRVNAVKLNHGKKYIGTDLGFNVFIRPVLYDSYHDLEVYPANDEPNVNTERVTVVGNICESGDIIARNRLLPAVNEGDYLGVMDAGAYAWVMSSNYNNRLRPAEVLINVNGEAVLIRKREELDDLVRHYL